MKVLSWLNKICKMPALIPLMIQMFALMRGEVLDKGIEERSHKPSPE